jgi:hypothetical protein
MAGLVGKQGTNHNTKAAAKTPPKQKGGQGQQQAQAPVPVTITYVWVCNAANPNQIIITFSKPVVWNASFAVNWRLSNATSVLTVQNIVVNSPTQVTITFSGPVNCANMFLAIPQNDPTFLGGQGQFVNPGKQSSGPQK